MKKLMTLFLAVAVAASCSAQAEQQNHDHSDHTGHNHEPAMTVSPVKPAGSEAPKAANPNAPKLKFVNDSHDFGPIPEGPQATYEFKFTNTGKEPLILSNVKASCGCTTPSWPKEPVLPGKDAVITATYNTQGRPGPFTKSITINSNADEATKVITIKGEVLKAEAEKTVPMAKPNMLAPASGN